MWKGSVTIQSFHEHDADLNRIGKLFCRTFTGDHYSDSELENAVSNITKHAGYEGFKGLKAKNQDDRLIGFAYGYFSLPHQFYRKRLELQLTPEQTAKWLSDCFEFVEMAVNPGYRRRRVGGHLHDKLLENSPQKTSVLTTSVDNFPAIQLYKQKGWEVVKADAAVISESQLQVIMGKGLS